MNERFDDYQQELDALRFTPAQKAQIAERAARAARQETRHARRPVRRFGLVATAAVLVLAVGTAGAIGVWKTAAESFAGIFGGDAAQTEIIDKIGRPIGASDSGNGLTITADAIIGDAYNSCVIYTVERTDGEVFDYPGNEYGYLPLHFRDQWTDFRGVQGGTHGSAYFTDATPGDSAIQFVETLSADVPVTAATAKATFGDLCWWDEDLGQDVPLVEGKWTLKFDVAYEDASVTLGGGETFRQSDMTFTVDEITVSPVAVRVAYTVDSEVQWSDAPSGRESDEDARASQRYFENVAILLTKTDGTVLDLTNAGGSISPQNGVTVCAKGRVMDEIVPLEELASISVGGIVYPIHET